ncbi:response regulator transcription factor [Schlegelella sp. S2-27]|uniref:Response regulator transcription factor n=1 Tax=Caldimonas mangrovi TaxID=2944811 RepID=A0ABT0YP08_9BURK|nr:response regulator transcription factor [Caldimonas mangrovi]MCM5680472.1 response regulator transcription factor [Caldimonas mangrovi]
MRVAALDDDPSQLDLVQRSVKASGHECAIFSKGQALLRELRRESFDLLVLDWQLPDVAGIDIVRWVRQNYGHPVPILLLTNRGDERDIVEGLSSGADDYMVKPIRVHELVARVRALIRRSYPQQEQLVLGYGGYCFNLASRTVEFEGQPIELKQKEFDLARCLFANQGRLLSRAYLIETVWGRAADIPSRSLDTHVSSLRSKLNLRPARGYRLTAVYGQGYRLEAIAELADSLPAAVEGQA